MALPQPLPAMLLPYCRLAHATEEADLQRPGLLDADGAQPAVISPQNEHAVVQQLLQYFQRRLNGCVRRTTPSKLGQLTRRCTGSVSTLMFCISSCNSEPMFRKRMRIRQRRRSSDVPLSFANVLRCCTSC